MKNCSLKAFFGFILAVTLINFASAALNWNYYLSSPSQLLYNEWVVFIGMFLLVFAVVYMSLSSIFGRETPQSPRDLIWGLEKRGPNKMPVVIISIVIALLVSAAFSQRGYLYGYLGDSIADWALFIIGLAVTGLAIRMLYVWMKLPGAIMVLIISWFVLQEGYYDFVPIKLQTYQFDVFYSVITSQLALFVLIIALIVSAGYALSRGRRPVTH